MIKIGELIKEVILCYIQLRLVSLVVKPGYTTVQGLQIEWISCNRSESLLASEAQGSILDHYYTTMALPRGRA